jgi:hypothetical protein
MKLRFRRFLSTDNPKAIKASGYGYLNAINYMAPHKSGGIGDLCGNASAGCIALCLGEHSGQAAMSETVRDSRKRKAAYFMRERKAFMLEFVAHIEKAQRDALISGLKLCVRPNGSTDLPFEAIACERDGIAYPNLMAAFPDVQFVDYTKNPKRFKRVLPPNYYLTFSRSEINENHAKDILENGFNVAAVFGDGLPDTYLGYPVINGDEHDLRHLDKKGVVIGLSPKGSRAKKDKSGFVIRNAA